MRSHHISRLLLAVTAVSFVFAAETYAQTTSTLNTNTPVVPLAQPATQVASLSVSVSDLSAAGFTGPAALSATQSAYMSPVMYFTVKESVAAQHPEWGNAANIVAVTIEKQADSTWMYNGGQLQMIDLFGRTQARVSRPGYYIVVTGPEANKVVALANALKTK